MAEVHDFTTPLPRSRNMFAPDDEHGRRVWPMSAALRRAVIDPSPMSDQAVRDQLDTLAAEVRALAARVDAGFARQDQQIADVRETVGQWGTGLKVVLWFARMSALVGGGLLALFAGEWVKRIHW